MRKRGIFSAFIVLAAYCFLRQVKQSPSLPSVRAIVESLFTILSSGAFYGNLAYTIRIVMTGIAFSLVAGFLIAVACSISRTANFLVMPVVNTTKNIPSIALFPLFIILMGIGDLPRITIIVWNSIYPIISSTMHGLSSVDDEVVDAAKNCGASKPELYFYIRIPLALVDVLEGLKISAGNGFIAIVVAEMLGATRGLGYMIIWSANAFKYPEMYCYILAVALIGLLINVAIEKIISLTERKMYHEENCKHCVGNGDDGHAGLHGLC